MVFEYKITESHDITMIEKSNRLVNNLTLTSLFLNLVEDLVVKSAHTP